MQNGFTQSDLPENACYDSVGAVNPSQAGGRGTKKGKWKKVLTVLLVIVVVLVLLTVIFRNQIADMLYKFLFIDNPGVMIDRGPI